MIVPRRGPLSNFPLPSPKGEEFFQATCNKDRRKLVTISRPWVPRSTPSSTKTKMNKGGWNTGKSFLDEKSTNKQDRDLLALHDQGKFEQL